MANVAVLSFEQRLGETLTRTLPKLGPETRAQLAAIITPESLAIIATVLVAWVVSHAFGVGEAIDIILLATGVLAIGMAVFSGLDHLYKFASGTYAARTDRDLDVVEELGVNVDDRAPSRAGTGAAGQNGVGMTRGVRFGRR